MTTNSIKEGKMKHLLIAVFIILGMITITGCAHKQVVQAPEQPAQPAPTTAAKAEAPKTVTEAPVPTGQQVEVRQAEREMGTKVQDILFDFDKSDIKDNAKPILKDLYGMLSANTKTNVVVEGN